MEECKDNAALRTEEADPNARLVGCALPRPTFPTSSSALHFSPLPSCQQHPNNANHASLPSHAIRYHVVMSHNTANLRRNESLREAQVLRLERTDRLRSPA